MIMSRPSSLVLLIPLLVLLVLVMLPRVRSDCVGEPSIDRVKELLQQRIPNISEITSTHTTCLAQGTMDGTYRHLSMIITTNIYQVQLELNCNQNNSWKYEQCSMINLQDGCNMDDCCMHCECWQNHNSNCLKKCENQQQILEPTTTKYNCYDCRNHTDPHRCNSCDPSCDTNGLKRCTGPTSTKCCVAFNEEGNCINTTTDCITPNYEANEHNNYTCGQVHQNATITSWEGNPVSSISIAGTLSSSDIHQQSTTYYMTTNTDINTDSTRSPSVDISSHSPLTSTTMITTDQSLSTVVSITITIGALLLGILIVSNIMGLVMIMRLRKKNSRCHIINKTEQDIELTTERHSANTVGQTESTTTQEKLNTEMEENDSIEEIPTLAEALITDTPDRITTTENLCYGNHYKNDDQHNNQEKQTQSVNTHIYSNIIDSPPTTQPPLPPSYDAINEYQNLTDIDEPSIHVYHTINKAAL